MYMLSFPGFSMSFRKVSIACRYAPLQATSGAQDHLPHQDRESFSDSIADDREDFSSDSAPLIGGRPCSPINSVGSSFLEGYQFFTHLSTTMLDSPVPQASYHTRSPLHLVLCNGITSDNACLGRACFGGQMVRHPVAGGACGRRMTADLACPHHLPTAFPLQLNS